MQIAIDELKEIAKYEIRRKERKEQEMLGSDEFENSDGTDSSENTFPLPETAGSRAEDNRIQSQYGGAFQAINSCQWINIDRIGTRLLGKKKLSNGSTSRCFSPASGICGPNMSWSMKYRTILPPN